ncbi:MAG: winged helix-turn-helix domain-containing protein [Actinomycetota bacterium]|nr:winged helix-turn-helix domain-containing protein [Actinomycetota bacterium]
MGIHMLGPVHVDGGEALTPRDRLVLSALAVRRGLVVAPTEIAEAVWGEDPPPSWPKQVQICVARLRKVLGRGVIDTIDGGYRLFPEAADLDVDDFEGLVTRGRELARTGEPDRSATAFARALALFRGEPFGGLDGWHHAKTESARLEELRRSAEDDLLEVRLAVGDHREVAALAETLVGQDPLRERRWAALALAQYRCGRQADALRTLRRARLLLLEQLGIDPGPELTSLEEQILRQDPALRATPVPRSISADCPYKGLAPLDAGDPLFGRDAEIAACLERLRAAPLLVVTGPSGSGKSSLVRAGLVPELQHRGRRRCVVVLPGPAGELTLPTDPVDPPTLVIDQLEDLFAAGRPTAEVRAACAQLAAYAVERAPVIVAVRADHLGDLAIDPALGRLAEENLHLLGPLAGEALREAIEQPAVEAGLRLETGLVDLVARDTEGEPGALPLMSHALAETWRRRDGNVLTVEGYRASGGIRGAVARSADRLYEDLPPVQRQVLRAVLLRLVAPSPDGEPVRCRVAGHTLRGDPDREHVVALLIRARLVTAEAEAVEISHEALARAWPRLRSWLDDDSTGQRVRRHLTAAADGWESLGKPESELYRGGRLETAEEFRQTSHPDLTPAEHAFLDASLRHEDSERAQLRARARQDARRTSRLRMLLAVAACLLVVAAVAGVAARDQANDASAARDEARLEALVNRSLALRSTDRDVAALLAVEAARRWPGDPRTVSALLGTFTGSPGFMSNRYVDGATSLNGALVTGTTRAVVALDRVRPEVIDLETGSTLVTFPAPKGDYELGRTIRVSADGRRAVHLLLDGSERCFVFGLSASSLGCGAFVVYDVVTGERLAGPVQLPGGPGHVAISDDGALVAVVASHDGALSVHRARDGRVVGELPGLRRPTDAEQPLDTGGVDFGPDGNLYLGSLGGPIRVVDPASVRVLRTMRAPAYHSNVAVDVGADGVLLGAGQRGLVAMAAATGRVLWTADLRGTNPDPCPWFMASEYTERVYCGNHYGEIEERDRSTGLRTGVVLDTQLGSVGDLATASAGKEVVAFGAETSAITRWRVDGGGPVTRRVADGHVASDGFDFEGGQTLLVARRPPPATKDSDFEDFAIWDLATDRQVDDLDVGLSGVGWVGRGLVVGMNDELLRFGWYDADSQSLVSGPDFGPECGHLWPSADGRRGYCAGLDGEVWTIDVASRELVGPMIRTEGQVWSVSATRGGDRVVVTAWTDGRPLTTVHDGATGERLVGPMHDAHMTSVSLDGELFGAAGGTITRYDLETLEPLGDLPGAHGEVNTLQFSDNGAILLATSNDQSASLYDVRTGTRLGDPIPTEAPLIFPAFLRRDGGALAVTDARGVALWDLDATHLRDAACLLAGRNLTRTEWASYVAELGSYRETCPGLPVLN